MNHANSPSLACRSPLPASPLRRRTATRTLRHAVVALTMLWCAGGSAVAQVSLGVSLPGVSIGINMPMYPQFVQVPNYPVYYAPRLQTNFFFYDGMYWVYQQDNWYTSSWYDGPWWLVGPDAVPLYVLRIPVRYYRNPPPYFRGWRRDAPPRWGEHWGPQWSQQRSGWDRWSRHSAPAPAPLPVYQRKYAKDRYPAVEQQQVLQSRNYRYQPRDATVRQHYQQQRGGERREPQAPGGYDKGRPPGPAAAPRPDPQQQVRGRDKAKGQDQGRKNRDDDERQRYK